MDPNGEKKRHKENQKKTRKTPQKNALKRHKKESTNTKQTQINKKLNKRYEVFRVEFGANSGGHRASKHPRNLKEKHKKDAGHHKGGSRHA